MGTQERERMQLVELKSVKFIVSGVGKTKRSYGKCWVNPDCVTHITERDDGIYIVNLKSQLDLLYTDMPIKELLELLKDE